MSTRRWFALGGVGVVVVAVLLAASRPGPAPVTPPVGSGGLVPAATSTAPPTVGPTTIPGAVGSGVPTASPVVPAVTPAPETAPPRASGDPRLAYAEFLLRVNDDRTTVADLNSALTAAAEAQDPDAVRVAAVAILDFVDLERDWLREHPPADCYAAAHASADAMLDAYGQAADRFVRWSASGGGLAGLAALGDALDAAQEASDALTAFGRALEATSCAA